MIVKGFCTSEASPQVQYDLNDAQSETRRPQLVKCVMSLQ